MLALAIAKGKGKGKAKGKTKETQSQDDALKEAQEEDGLKENTGRRWFEGRIEKCF